MEPIKNKSGSIDNLKGLETTKVVLSLLGGQDGNGRQNAECVSGQEDDVLGVGAAGLGTDDLHDVVDGVGNTGVLGDGAVLEVALAFGINSNVLQQSVAADSVVDVGLGILVQADDLSSPNHSAIISISKCS